MFILKNALEQSIEVDRFTLVYDTETYERKAYTPFYFKPYLVIEVGQNVPETKEYYEAFFGGEAIRKLSFTLDGNLVKEFTNTDATVRVLDIDGTKRSLNITISNIDN